MINKWFQRVTDWMCYAILASTFFFSMASGAYSHVMREIAMEHVLTMNLAQLSDVSVV